MCYVRSSCRTFSLFYVVAVFTNSLAFINNVFILDEIFYFLVNQRGNNGQCFVWNEIRKNIFKIVLFRINIFSLSLVFTKAVSKSIVSIARLIRSVFAS